jgi:hypothetical protein
VTTWSNPKCNFFESGRDKERVLAGCGHVRRGLRAAIVTTLSAAIAAAILLAPSGDAVGGGIQATVSDPDRTVGPLFSGGLAADHKCTASVLSAGRDLLLTAAHCLVGTGAGVQFVPGYDGTAAEPTPYGVWTVTRTWVPAGWLENQDPDHDYAILQVTDLDVGGRSASINETTGGNDISVPLFGPPSRRVTVEAYNAGSDDAPIRCTASADLHQAIPSFGCEGYSAGTSGAPWLQDTGFAGRRVVVGVIGGSFQGGCLDSVSYSPKFDWDVVALLLRATLNLRPDDVPAAGDNGC